ncbi:ABC transporter ATP-binding protein [Moorena sp. SIO4G3]|uniref:ABC transporter ATP-binding protein n=1 Tax=Moorena sp. SIO4G3 TaxID=2607821 RepID=UPI001429228E|nr:ABC transporter ATP-binding protein [Moorena sp. SIO4G3]NEO76411.1 ABC transporter ATP-binding protein [Moorena sp. SIO4G3]
MPRIKRALLFVWHSAPTLTTIKVILIIVQGLLPLALLYLTKLVVDTVATSLTLSDKQAAFSQIMFLLAVAGGVTLVTSVSQSLSQLVSILQSQKVTDYMEGMLHDKSMAVDLEYYENAEYYDMLQRAQRDAPELPNQILHRLAEIGQNSVSLLAIVGLLLSFHWGIAGVLFVVGIPTMLVRLKYAKIMYHWQRERTPIRRRANYYGGLLTRDRPAKEIRLFDLGSVFSQRFHQLRWQLYRESFTIAKSRSMANLGAQAFSGIIMLAAYGFIIYQTVQGLLTLGDLALYHQAFKRGQSAFSSVLGGLSEFYKDSLFLNNLYEFLDLQPKITELPHPKLVPQPIQKGIVFNNVSFQYANTTRQALKTINLTLQPGETIALVGENGSGKTTLIKLLCRLYEPTSGSITIDGIDLRQFQLDHLRQQISVIFQDYMKYHLTAQENIWLGNVALSPTDNQISKAAFRSGADRVINTLPNGYDTMLGKLFDQGEQLSIGQWQKIALARAFLRDSQVIVLDEPTSAMDPKAEYEVFQKFRQLIKDQAAILISHRLSTVKMADRIYVMDKGSITESGTHEELMQLDGTYAYLFETQAQNYR